MKEKTPPCSNYIEMWLSYQWLRCLFTPLALGRHEGHTVVCWCLLLGFERPGVVSLWKFLMLFFEGEILKAFLHQIKIRREKLYEMKCHDLDLISLIYYVSFSLLNLQDFQYVLSFFNEYLQYKVFERCKPVVLAEASSASPAHYSCLFAWTSSKLHKPEDQYESNDNVELKNTSKHMRRP